VLAGASEAVAARAGPLDAGARAVESDRASLPSLVAGADVSFEVLARVLRDLDLVVRDEFLGEPKVGRAGVGEQFGGIHGGSVPAAAEDARAIASEAGLRQNPAVPDATPPALVLESLAKRYPTGVDALRGVSLEIGAGEFHGLLGPNGAGKSTLIHCVTGLAMPTGGAARVFGHDAVHSYGAARSLVGLAPQDINLDQFLTVFETLDYHGGYFGMARRDRHERAQELLEAFSLTDKANDKTRFLSGGMKRRVVLARALMHRPRLLILDEPTAGVDVELRLELWHYVQRINAEGTTVLLTTHYLEEAEQLCDHIAFIDQGSIVARGTPDELRRTYDAPTLEEAYLQVVGRTELSRANGDAS
jgi:ABC-2 type transport system ATP-binding protein